MEDVSKISGTAVYGSDDSKIGSVSTVLMNPESKTIDRLVVNSGGILGVGGHKVAVPIDQLTWDSDKGAFKIAKTTDDVKSMPEWQSETARATTD
jgi:sporulation protein YlmC with PRC-barrel domain